MSNHVTRLRLVTENPFPLRYLHEKFSKSSILVKQLMKFPKIVAKAGRELWLKYKAARDTYILEK